MALSQLTEKERTYAILAVIFGVLALVAIIVSGVSLGRPGTPVLTIKEMNGQATAPPGNGAGESSSVGHAGPASINSGAQVWSIAVGHDNGAHEYIDSKGYIKGFGPDLIHAVCEVTELHCRLVWDRYENCWFSEVGRHSAGGKGLMNKWYDACSGWMITVDRIQVFDFSSPYMESDKTHFYIKVGANFDTTDFSSKRIGFLDGWPSDEKCMNRQTKVELPVENVIYVKSKDELLRMLNVGQIDAAFVTEGTFELEYTDQKIDIAKDRVGKLIDYNCVMGGTAIMARKDSLFLNYWNNGFAQLVQTGRFQEICEKAMKTHGHRGSVKCAGIQIDTTANTTDPINTTTSTNNVLSKNNFLPEPA